MRDGGCVFPGCDRPVQWCDAHHVEEWDRDHGNTDLALLALTCRHHHGVTHRRGWTMVAHPDQTFTWTTPAVPPSTANATTDNEPPSPSGPPPPDAKSAPYDLGVVDRYQYLLLMAGCAVLTLPLELVLHAGVYRRAGRLVRALWLPVAVFVAWDTVAIHRGHWRFNPRYVTGWTIPGGVPVEEVAFFVVIPTCALLSLGACSWLLARRAGRDDA